MGTRTRTARAIALGSFLALFLQQALDAWSSAAPWIVWAAVLVPLLLFLPGVLRDNLRSYIWLCFVCLLYFMRLVLENFAHPGKPLALAGMAAVVALFCSAMMYVRWRARELRADPGPATGNGDPT